LREAVFGLHECATVGKHRVHLRKGDGMGGYLRSPGPAVVTACILGGWAGTGTAGAVSACGDLGGTVDSDHICHVHTVTSNYTLDYTFPVDYPDQQAVSGALTDERDRFVNWVATSGPDGRDRPYQEVVTAMTYRSGTPATGTQSLVLEIEDDTGAAHQGHPDTRFTAFNYDLGKGGPITFDTLFKPGTAPLRVLYPAVQRELATYQSTAAPTFDGLDPNAYQNFAITDDVVIFFFGENRLIQDDNGPHEVSVPRADLASLMAV
jgi:hypothetical protein